MTGSAPFCAARIRRAAFALWGWAMLLLVAVCAVPSAAQPGTQLVGSAFDPSSVSVAVGAEKRAEGTSSAKLRRDGRTPPAAMPFPTAERHVPWPAGASSFPAPAAVRPPPGRLFALASGQAARAPPRV